MTQQQLMDSAWGAVSAVNPTTKLTRKTINMTVALTFFINSHLLLDNLRFDTIGKIVSGTRRTCTKWTVRYSMSSIEVARPGTNTTTLLIGGKNGAD